MSENFSGLKYDEASGKFVASGDTGLIVIRGDETSEKPLKWIWKPYLPAGKLVHFGGNSSQAKSPVTVDLAARITTGADWPDGAKNEQGPRSVILLNIEDDFQDTILPRFRLAGGDKSKLYYVKGTRIVKDDIRVERGVALLRDTDDLTRLAKNTPDLGALIIDPITNYLGGAKMNAEEDVRAVLTPVANLAAEFGITAITVGHFNRRERGTDPLHRMMGAAAFSGVARAVYAFGPDPDDESKYAHVMTVVRAAGGEGPALRYRTELATEVCPDSLATDIIRVIWCGTSTATAEDSVDPQSSKEKGQQADAAKLLKKFLQDGRKSAEECAQYLEAEGFPLQEVKDGKIVRSGLNPGKVRARAAALSKRFAGEKFYSWYLEYLQ